jgi:hypothetical protein
MADKVAGSSVFNLICTTSNERMCISTVSIVGCRVRDRLPMPVPAHLAGLRCRGRCRRYFRAPYDSDHPSSWSAFTTEGNVDAQDPKERLRATQAASERAGIFGPACTPP